MKTYRIIQSVLVATAVVSMLPIAQAAIPGENGIITGCFSKSSGAVRIIDAASTTCNSSEIMVKWNIQGPQGEPGPVGATGLTGPQGPAASKADGPCYNDNASRYQNCGNGTVTDTVTGLIWLENANCFGKKEWADANTSAVNLADGQCGLTDNSAPGDWRLPTKEEWEATVAPARAMGPPCTYPALTNMAGSGCYSSPEAQQPFSCVQSNYYWSSTTDSSYTVRAWGVYLDGGPVGAYGKTNYYSVWPVRNGR